MTSVQGSGRPARHLRGARDTCARRDAGALRGRSVRGRSVRGRASALLGCGVPTQTPAPAAGDRSAHGRDPEAVTPAALRAERTKYIGGGRRDPFQCASRRPDSRPIRRTVPWLTWGTSTWWHMWGSPDKFALVEDSRGHGYVLRGRRPSLNVHLGSSQERSWQGCRARSANPNRCRSACKPRG